MQPRRLMSKAAKAAITLGLLNNSLQPSDETRVARTIWRHRAGLVAQASAAIPRMHQAPTEMNVQLGNVLSDLSGASGMAIVTAILDGERDPHKLAGLAKRQVKASTGAVIKITFENLTAGTNMALCAGTGPDFIAGTCPTRISDSGGRMAAKRITLPARGGLLKYRTASLVFALVACAPTDLWSRIPIPESTIDLTEFTATAPIVFRGKVLAVFILQDDGNLLQSVARFQVDRSYRGESGSDVPVYFRPYDPMAASQGHSCIDFKPDSYWLVFATQESGHLELVHDCNGAVRVSSLLAPRPESTDVVAQIEEDLTAGLEDPDQAARLLSIQRLGGLRSASSRPALHRVIQGGNPTEVKWAVYAALRTGDASILPRVRDLLSSDDSEAPLSFVAWELRRLKDRSATAGLMEIADTAPDPVVRGAAISALSEIKAPESLPTIASHLTDPAPRVRYYALRGLKAITHEPACTLPSEPQWTEDMIEPQIRQCLVWWEQVGHLSFNPDR